MRLSELAFVEPNENKWFPFHEAPAGFQAYAICVGYVLTPLGIIPVIEYEQAIPTWRGELMVYEGAQYAMPCGDKMLTYDVVWN